MSKTYTAAVIGAGMGGKASMKGLSDSDCFELLAVTDLRAETQEEVKGLYPNIQTFSNHRDMFAQCPTDIVCVSTWPPSHLEVTRDALNLPLTGIVVEKPLADNSEDGRKICNLIRKKNLPVAVPHGLLVSDHIDHILAHAQNGELGEIKLIEIQCTNWDIINAGIHWLNFVVTLVDEPFDHVLATCDKTTRTYRDGMQVETLAVTTAQTKSGIRVVMHTGDHVTINHTGGGTVFRILGTKGDIEFYGWQSTYRIRNAKYPNGELIDVPTRPGTRHQLHLENLAAQMDRGEPDYRIIESSWAALELCEAAYISARQGCAISLPLADFPLPDKNDWDPGIPYSGSGGGRNGRKL